MANYYSSLKLFNYPDKIESIRQGEIIAPIHIRLKPTNVCNHRCWYCGYQNSDSALSLGEGLQHKDEIPYDKMVEICDDLIDMQVKAVTFTGGGEPLCYRHIAETASRLVDGGLEIALLTNGALLAQERAAAFANRASWVRVSMDGWDDESYRSYRGVKNQEYTKISKNLEDFACKKGQTTLGVALNVDKENYSHIYDFIARMRELGVDHVKVSGCIVSNEGSENNSYHEPFFEQAVEQIQKATEDFSSDSFSVINLYHSMPGLFEKTYSRCLFCQFLVVIAADQMVYSCQDKAYTEGGGGRWVQSQKDASKIFGVVKSVGKQSMRSILLGIVSITVLLTPRIACSWITYRSPMVHLFRRIVWSGRGIAELCRTIE